MYNAPRHIKLVHAAPASLSKNSLMAKQGDRSFERGLLWRQLSNLVYVCRGDSKSMIEKAAEIKLCAVCAAVD